jgi:hypothetical protein
MHQASSSDSGAYYMINNEGTGNYLTLWRVHCSLCAPSSLSIEESSIGVPSYKAPPKANQPGHAASIETTDGRFNNAVFQSNTLWTAHAVTGSFAPGRAANRVYRIVPGSDPGVGNLEHATTAATEYYDPTGGDYYNPAVMPTSANSLRLIESYSSLTTYVTSALSAPDGAFALKSGNGVISSSDGFGDYSAAALDPDGTTVWAYNEIGSLPSSNTANSDYDTWVSAVSYQ